MSTTMIMPDGQEFDVEAESEQWAKDEARMLHQYLIDLQADGETPEQLECIAERRIAHMLNFVFADELAATFMQHTFLAELQLLGHKII